MKRTDSPMSDPLWTAVDLYLQDLFVAPDVALDRALHDSQAAGLPSINVSPNQGKLLHLLARAAGARLILEIGTLGGYSAIWLARALPAGGRVITLEAAPQHAEMARANITRAGLAGIVDVRLGPALATLSQLASEGLGPFDFVVIDADKENYSNYFAWALQHSRTGTVIIADNVVRKGAVIDADSADAAVQGVRRFNETIAREPRVTASAIQTVGCKGYDGFVMAVVTSAS
jgi:predicted O-methyltransferase YrrM